MLVAVNVFVGDDVRPRRYVLAVDIQHDIRLGQVQQVRVARHIPRMITQPLRAVVSLTEPGTLQQGAPGPIEHHDALIQKLTQGLARPCHR